jgi:CubicO group peptidase (beta-lactamase class C family)
VDSSIREYSNGSIAKPHWRPPLAALEGVTIEGVVVALHGWVPCLNALAEDPIGVDFRFLFAGPISGHLLQGHYTLRMNRHTFTALSLVLFGGCATTDSWPVSTLEAEGIDPEAIAKVVEDIEEGRYGLIDHFTLIRNGRMVADHQFDHDYVAISAPHVKRDHQYDYDHPDWHPYYQGTDLHTLQSVTKSVTSAVLGIAMDEGFIPGGVNTPAMSWFEDYAPDMTEEWRREMTLEDLLTMRSGIDWNEMISYGDATNSCILMEDSDTWIQFIIDQPMREEPGTKFDYNSGASVLIGKIVREATGRRIDDYAREKLFEPLGITDFYWKITPDGECDTEGGLYLSAHDLARIAQLFLQDGVWNGERIVSEEWVTASITPHVEDVAPDNPMNDQGYGYQWWIAQHEDGEARLFQGSGYGGQFPVVVPEHDMVMVFNAWNIHDPSELSIWRAMFQVSNAVVEPE